MKSEIKKELRALVPGMRTLKTAITVVLCVALGHASPYASPFFIALAGIITIQVSTIDSYKMGRTRILGTVVGALVGLVFAVIGPENPLLAGVGIVVVIQICDKLKWNPAIQIATVVFMAIMTNMRGHDPLTYSLSRLADTSIGVLVALGINYFIAPYNNLPQIKSSFKMLSQITANLLAIFHEEDGVFLERLSDLKLNRMAYDPVKMPEEIGDLSQMREMLLKLRDQIKHFEMEAKVNHVREEEIKPYKVSYENYWDIYEHMKHLKTIARSLENQGCADLGEGSLKCEEYLTVFRFHFNAIVGDVDQLKKIAV